MNQLIKMETQSCKSNKTFKVFKDINPEIVNQYAELFLRYLDVFEIDYQGLVKQIKRLDGREEKSTEDCKDEEKDLNEEENILESKSSKIYDLEEKDNDDDIVQEPPNNTNELWEKPIDGFYKQHADIFFLLAVMYDYVLKDMHYSSKIKFLDLTGTHGMAVLATTFLCQQRLSRAVSVEDSMDNHSDCTRFFENLFKVDSNIQKQIELITVHSNFMKYQWRAANMILISPFSYRYYYSEHQFCKWIEEEFKQQIPGYFLLVLTAQNILLDPQFYQVITCSKRCFGVLDIVYATLYKYLG